jgi:hypothetical protein
MIHDVMAQKAKYGTEMLVVLPGTWNYITRTCTCILEHGIVARIIPLTLEQDSLFIQEVNPRLLESSVPSKLHVVFALLCRIFQHIVSEFHATEHICRPTLLVLVGVILQGSHLIGLFNLTFGSC